MIKTKAIDHVWLWVRSLEEAKCYYESVFGFTCIPRADDESTLIVESETVHFFLREGGNEGEFLSKQHLSFEVESIDSVIATLNKICVTEYQLGEVGFFVHRNYRWCQWQDPSGIQLECVEVV